MNTYEEGKLEEYELEECLKNFHIKHDEVIKGSKIGEDAALIKLKGNYLFSTDPITALVDNIGIFSLIVSSNDIFASGGIPKFALTTLILPLGFDSIDISKIFEDISKTADKYDIDIVGGHTEYSSAVIRPIVSTTIIGESKRTYNKSKLSLGDGIYVTKDLCIEANRIISNLLKEKSKYSLDDLSIATESGIFQKHNNVIFMHDITEGGISGATQEILTGTNFGANIYEDLMPFDIQTLKYVDRYNLDKFSLISSGSLLVVINGDATTIIAEFKNCGISLTKIGEVVDGDSFIKLSNGKLKKIEIKKDEIYRVREE